MIDIIKRVENPKERLMLECECGSVIIFDEEDINITPLLLDGEPSGEACCSFECPVCRKNYVSHNLMILKSNFVSITEEDAKIKTKNILRGLE